MGMEVEVGTRVAGRKQGKGKGRTREGGVIAQGDDGGGGGGCRGESGRGLVRSVSDC